MNLLSAVIFPIIAILILAGGLLLGFVVGRFTLILKGFDMSIETDALKAVMDQGAALATELSGAASNAVAQLKDGAAIATERDALKADVATLTQTVADTAAKVTALQAEAAATNDKHAATVQALTSAVSAAVGGIPPAAPPAA